MSVKRLAIFVAYVYGIFACLVGFVVLFAKSAIMAKSSDWWALWLVPLPALICVAIWLMYRLDEFCTRGRA